MTTPPDDTLADFWFRAREATPDLPPDLPEAWSFDGIGRPRAVIETTDVRVVAFDEVDSEHARSEREGDRSLAAWREIHERYWRFHAKDSRGWAADMPVVCERFRLVYRGAPGRHADPAESQRSSQWLGRMPTHKHGSV